MSGAVLPFLYAFMECVATTCSLPTNNLYTLAKKLSLEVTKCSLKAALTRGTQKIQKQFQVRN
jgi:hypothetical protein